MKPTATTEPLTLDLIDTDTKPANIAVQATGQMALAEDPMSRAAAFLRAGGNLEALEKMMALQERFEANQAKKAFTDAMAEFKQHPPEILKDKHVFFEGREGKTGADYWHATLGNVTQSIIEGLAKVGISHSWKPERKGDRIHVTCTLTHKLGHSESVELDGPLEASGTKNAIQQAASTTTYLSRYTLLMITGLAVRDEVMPDTDGRGARMPTPEELIREDLLLAARSAAMDGWKALAKFIKEAKPEDRIALEPISAKLKAAAKEADTITAAAADPRTTK